MKKACICLSIIVIMSSITACGRAVPDEPKESMVQNQPEPTVETREPDVEENEAGMETREPDTEEDEAEPPASGRTVQIEFTSFPLALV